MEVRHRISEQLVVHVARRKHMLDHLRDAVNVAPVRRDFGGAQTREVGNVTIAKDDDRMAASDGVPLQVCVTRASCVKRLTELVPTKPAPRPLFAGVPVLRPCSCHCLCLPRGVSAARRSAAVSHSRSEFETDPLPSMQEAQPRRVRKFFSPRHALAPILLDTFSRGTPPPVEGAARETIQQRTLTAARFSRRAEASRRPRARAFTAGGADAVEKGRW
jgi:hypothetical protein